jgi:transcriptional regulator of acetoin/glycerol metabolism
MEPIRAVEMSRDAVKSRCVESDAAGLVVAHRSRQKVPAAYFIRESDLVTFAGLFPDSFTDRGRKHPARPLASYLRDRSGLLAIRAGYTNAAQAERGVRSLLNSAANHRTGTTFLIAVSAALLDELWKRALPPDHVTTGNGHSAGFNAQLKALLDRCSSRDIPAPLREAFLGQSEAAEIVRRLIVCAARTDHPVLILGETGTGKEVVARQIHQLSARAAESFVEINCGGIPGELLESELFGHKKGAFTGALRDKPGLWTIANNGTLFLDEIGDLTLQHQVKILRALENGRFRPVGAAAELTSQARIIAATNRDLAQMVSAGLFREDLYYRLFTFPIRTPALREHPDDIPELADRFWEKISNRNARPLPHTVTQALQRYAWPGNARELRSFLINVFLLADQMAPDVPLIATVMQDRLGQGIHFQTDQ